MLCSWLHVNVCPCVLKQLITMEYFTEYLLDLVSGWVVFSNFQGLRKFGYWLILLCFIGQIFALFWNNCFSNRTFKRSFFLFPTSGPSSSSTYCMSKPYFALIMVFHRHIFLRCFNSMPSHIFSLLFHVLWPVITQVVKHAWPAI